MTEKLLTPTQVAEQLAISRSLLYEMLARGELPSLTIGRTRRIPASAVERWIAEQLDPNGGTPWPAHPRDPSTHAKTDAT